MNNFTQLTLFDRTEYIVKTMQSVKNLKNKAIEFCEELLSRVRAIQLNLFADIRRVFTTLEHLFHNFHLSPEKEELAEKEDIEEASKAFRSFGAVKKAKANSSKDLKQIGASWFCKKGEAVESFDYESLFD